MLNHSDGVRELTAVISLQSKGYDGPEKFRPRFHTVHVQNQDLYLQQQKLYLLVWENVSASVDKTWAAGREYDRR